MVSWSLGKAVCCWKRGGGMNSLYLFWCSCWFIYLEGPFCIGLNAEEPSLLDLWRLLDETQRTETNKLTGWWQETPLQYCYSPFRCFLVLGSLSSLPPLLHSPLLALLSFCCPLCLSLFLAVPFLFYEKILSKGTIQRASRQMSRNDYCSLARTTTTFVPFIPQPLLLFFLSPSPLLQARDMKEGKVRSRCLTISLAFGAWFLEKKRRKEEREREK